MGSMGVIIFIYIHGLQPGTPLSLRPSRDTGTGIKWGDEDWAGEAETFAHWPPRNKSEKVKDDHDGHSITKHPFVFI